MDLVKDYDNRARVPDHPAIIAGWHAEAAAFRERASAEPDLAYGARPRNRVDIFHPSTATADAPLVVFIHGGYWRAFDKSGFSHMAQGVLARGLPVAVPSYTLCPEVGISEIVDEMRQCCLFLGRHSGRRLVVSGHSAGGHLAACMAATRWEAYGAPADLVMAGMAISGVFDLRPLLATPFNADLRMDATTALAASPLLWPVPRPLAFDLWVGATESPEFLRQSLSLAAAWTGLGMAAHYVEVAGANHFSVVLDLADPASAMSRRLAALAGA